MRWVVMLSASPRDVERVTAASLAGLAAADDGTGRLILELHDPEGDAVGDAAPHAAKAVIDATVQYVNGFGKLRWGRTFEGVAVEEITSFDGDGRPTQRVFVESATAHLDPREFADVIERLGRPRPPMPRGIEMIEALDGVAVAGLAAGSPVVGRVLHLIDLMLRADREVDWVAAYSAFEAIAHDLRDRGLDGRKQGWWTKRELSDFRGTANSLEALGPRARHGTPGGVPEARMTDRDASWFVRRIAAQWLTHLLDR